MGWRTPSALHPDTVYLDLLAGVLGRGRAGRLYRALRERRLASSVSADNYTPTEIGVFTLHAEGPAECARDAAAAMWGELAAVRESGVSEGEVERTQRLFEARWLRRLETMEGQANYLAEWESLGDWRLSEEYFDQMMSATAPQVTQVARQYLSAEEASFLVYRPKEVPPLASDAADARNALLTAAFPVVGPAPGKKRDGFRGSRALKLELERVAAGVHLYRSPSGVPILVRPRPGSPIVHFGVYSRVGAASEPDDVAGLATLATRAALKGTETRTAEEIAGESELLGGSIGSSVTSDGLGWTFSVPVGRVEPAVELLADVVQHPRYADESIETERVIALANLAELRDDMYRYPLRLATAAAYDGHPYGRGQLGTEESLHAIRAADVREWHRKSVMEAPTIIAVVGDVDALPAASLLAGAFDALSEVNVPEVSAPTWPAAMRQIVEEREKRQTALAVAFQGPARKDPARFAARLMATVASGLGGRFFETLREKQSLAYTVHAHAVERAAAGSFVAYIATSPEREEIARAGLLSEFERLRAEPVATKELDRAKTYTLGAHAIASQSGGAILGEMIDAWLYGSGLEELEEFEGRVRSVTVREMRDVAERYFDQERHVEGIVRGR
jgi:zinc protease